MSETSDEEPPPIVRTVREAGSDKEEYDREWEVIDAADKAKQLKSLFANRIFVQPGSGHLRISFGEQVGDEVIYHSAITVPNLEAVEFGELIQRMAQANFEQQAAYFRALVAQSDQPAPHGGQTNGD